MWKSSWNSVVIQLVWLLTGTRGSVDGEEATRGSVDGEEATRGSMDGEEATRLFMSSSARERSLR